MDEAEIKELVQRFDIDVARNVGNGLLAQGVWHRHQVEGLDNIPAGPAMLIGNHSGGLNPVDGLFLIGHYAHRTDPIHPLGHAIFFATKPVRSLLATIGVLPATPLSMRAAIEAGHKTLVFPGGDIDSLRSFWRRNEVDFGGRKGFARLAVELNVPIVPLATHGAQAGWMVLWQGREIANALRMPTWAKMHSFPVALSFPWGLTIGPTSYLPYLPMPVRVRQRICAPIMPQASGDFETRVEALYRQTEAALSHALQELDAT